MLLRSDLRTLIHVRLGPVQDCLRQGDVENAGRAEQHGRQLYENFSQHERHMRRNGIGSSEISGEKRTHENISENEVGFEVGVLTAMRFAFIAAHMRVAGDPSKNDREDHAQEDAPGDNPCAWAHPSTDESTPEVQTFQETRLCEPILCF